MDAVAGRRRNTRPFNLGEYVDGKENVDADNISQHERTDSKSLINSRESLTSALAPIRIPSSPAARSSYRASSQFRGSAKIKGFGDPMSPVPLQTAAAKTLWTARPANPEVLISPLEVSQSPIFMRKSAALSQQEEAVTPRPAAETPFKFKVTVGPNRREVVAEVPSAQTTPTKDSIAYALPMPCASPARAEPKQTPNAAPPASNSTRKRSNIDYSESPAKRRRISFGTKSTRKTIVPPLALSGTISIPSTRDPPKLDSIFVSAPNSARSRSGSVSDDVAACAQTPQNSSNQSNGSTAPPTPLVMTSLVPINTHLNVPASKEADVPLTIQEIAAWAIFGQDDKEVVSSVILAHIHFKTTPRELFKMVWAFYHQPPLQYWKLVSTFANQRAKVVDFVNIWTRISPNDFEWTLPPPQTPGMPAPKGNKVPLKFIHKFIEMLRSDSIDASNLEELCDVQASKNPLETPRKMSATNANGSTGGPTSPRRQSSTGASSVSSSSRRQSKYAARRQSSVKAGEAVTLEQIEPAELALQMTLMDFNRLRSVPMTELVGQAWNKPEKTRIAPRLTNIINHFNNVSYWVAQEISQRDTAKEQAKMIDMFITVGNKLKDLGNFNGLMEVYSGLMSSNVQKLQDAWKQVSSSQKSKYKKFETLMSPFQNSANYRTKLSACTKSPVIPYIGIHLGDIVHLIEGIDDEIPDKYALQKVLKLGEMLKLWQTWQKQTCEIVEDSDITQFLALLRGAVSKSE